MSRGTARFGHYYPVLYKGRNTPEVQSYMASVADSELLANADRVKDKVVLITGGANGLGRSAALLFGRHGAKVVIGDLDLRAAEDVASQIRSAGSDAVAQKCDVTSWEQQLSLFQFAISTYNQIDIVIPCAGVTELGTRDIAVDGIPTKPNLKTLEVNLIAVLYSARLALFYLLKNKTESPAALKAIVFVGSMSSFEGIPAAPLYTTSKHGLVGLMGSLFGQYHDSIRLSLVCPWFADTALVPIETKLVMAGIPLTPISRIAGTIFSAASDPDPETNGAIYTLPDHRETFRINRAQLQLNEGVYKLLQDRTRFLITTALKIRYWITTIRDLVKIGGPKILPLVMSILLGVIAWRKLPALRKYLV